MRNMTSVDTGTEPQLPLPSRLAEQIKQLIYVGEFQPGDRLNEAALAARMETSRGPIREAIRILTGFGLVTAVPNRGVYVRQMSVREMVEVSDLRAVVFGYAAGLAAEFRNKHDCAELERLCDSMDAAADAGDQDLYYSLNLEFHALITSLSGSTRADKLYHDFVKELHLFRRRDFDNRANMRTSNAEHRLICQAIQAGSKSDAMKSAEQHIILGCQRMLRTMEGVYARNLA